MAGLCSCRVLVPDAAVEPAAGGLLLATRDIRTAPVGSGMRRVVVSPSRWTIVVPFAVSTHEPHFL